MKTEKGQPGYIKARKNRLLLYTAAEFAVVAGLLITGFVQTGTRLNMLTLVAVLGCLPASKMLVGFIAIAPYKTIDDGQYREIEEKAPMLTKSYDMVITSKEKIMPVAAVVISEHTVCGYAPNPKTDEAKAAAHIKSMLLENHIDKMTVKIFRDYKAFLTRAEGMNSIAAIDRPSTEKLEKQIRNVILNISM